MTSRRPALTDDSEPEAFILGQSWPRDLRAGGRRLGVPVVDRWPGFPARRWLRDGDLILGLSDDPDGPPDCPPELPTHDVPDLLEAMRQCRSRPRVTLSLVRDGRPLRVTMDMVSEPAQTRRRHAAAVAAFALDRQRRADAYWRSTFAPLVDGPEPDPPGEPQPP